MNRHLIALSSALALLSGCPAPETGCGEFEEVFVWADADGDGFGGDQPIGWICEAARNQATEATNNVDCDDETAEVNPAAEELCDLLDNDCDTFVDESLPKVPWYNDLDGDGFGSDVDVTSACVSPGSSWVPVSGDCNDGDRDINAGVIEICNGIDDDCDTFVDDADLGVDPSTYTRWHTDTDADGFGAADNYLERCSAPLGAIEDGTDCNDLNDNINPGIVEICNGNVDDDCDGLADDLDDSIDPASQNSYYADLDADGYGDASNPAPACVPTVGIAVNNTLDCDDGDSGANIDQGWFLDQDNDGVGAGAQLVFQCLRPGAGTAPASAGVDCAPLDSAIYPGADETCGDLIDQDCSGVDQCPSCQRWLEDDPSLTSGIYRIEPTTGIPIDAYCDMETDDGGWTLVGSSRFTTFNDSGSATFYTDLRTLAPLSGHADLWNGMRAVVEGSSDIRFACKATTVSTTMAVDLSFYDNGWYSEVTTGSDASSCFNELDGVGADPPPARRDNITGAFLVDGDQWTAGYLEGEDTCGDQSDFTVDFDDRGMAGVVLDGTDWGEANGTTKCGTVAGQMWFVFVREL